MLSTEGMVNCAPAVAEARVRGRHRDRHPAPAGKEAPDKRFYAMSERAVCRYMKMITLEKLRDSLRDMRHVVTVDPEVADQARGAIQRMVEIVYGMLILVPTALESDLLFPDEAPGQVVVCGFGLAAAGAGAAHAIAAHRRAAADGVILVGAAGTYDADRHPVGSAIDRRLDPLRRHRRRVGGRPSHRRRLGFAAIRRDRAG